MSFESKAVSKGEAVKMGAKKIPLGKVIPKGVLAHIL
jgi:hypothetical protein